MADGVVLVLRMLWAPPYDDFFVIYFEGVFNLTLFLWRCVSILTLVNFKRVYLFIFL